jgi:hypothetical protein
MAFSSLLANPEIMRSGNESQSVIEAMTDTDLQQSQRTSALAHLKSDILRSCSLQESDTARLDELADNNTETLSLALGYLQLYLIFQTNWAGSESFAAMKVAEYRKLYNDLRNGFASMRSTEAISPIRSVQVKRG